MKRISSPLIALVAVVAMLLGVTTAASAMQTPSQPTSDAGVVPYIVTPAGPGGNLDCAQVPDGEFAYTSERINWDQGDPLEFVVPISDGVMITGNATITYDPDTKTLRFDATIPIEVVIVKGSNEANVYDYRPDPHTSDSGLGAPPTNLGGPFADLSNITLCTNPMAEPPTNEWCSPGFWRQPQHEAFWDATGYATTDLYQDAVGSPVIVENPRQARGLSFDATNPTLLQVLQYPQVYGGEQFNAVGDLLSTAHPDVDFEGERTEDSCPL